MKQLLIILNILFINGCYLLETQHSAYHCGGSISTWTYPIVNSHVATINWSQGDSLFVFFSSIQNPQNQGWRVYYNIEVIDSITSTQILLSPDSLTFHSIYQGRLVKGKYYITFVPNPEVSKQSVGYLRTIIGNRSENKTITVKY